MNEQEAQSLKIALRDIQRQLKEKKTIASFYKDIGTFKLKPLQDISFQSDLSRFKEENFILSVIISIIAHPHFSPRGEEELVRAQKASLVLPDMFQQTAQDPTLWKKSRQGMVPEYVHHLQSVDDIKIYENIFIVKVLNMIDLDVLAYRSFYAYLIGNISSNRPLSNAKSQVEEGFKELRKLERKLKRIKETWFYREVSKAKAISSRIVPTNILLKDNLYNYCFRYYRKMFSSFQPLEASKDLSIYFFLIILKELKKEDWELATESGRKDISFAAGTLKLSGELKFVKEPFKLTLKYLEEGKISFEYESPEGIKATHLMISDPDLSFALLKEQTAGENDDLISLSIWGDGRIFKDETKIFNLGLKEEEAIRSLLTSFVFVEEGSEEIYTSFCPFCASRQLALKEDNTFTCLDCSSSWALIEANKKKLIWLKKTGWRG
ncbi:MAG: hypothetical protein LKJ88_02130 [Bacilli bacterium]|jgi:hypothetical protein|nr:hypothetical protein [Bacilli bacterium]